MTKTQLPRKFCVYLLGEIVTDSNCQYNNFGRYSIWRI